MRLGISAEVLRRRLDRGEAWGFERDGISFVYVHDLSTGDLSTGDLSAGDLSAGDLAAERRFGGAGASADGTLPVVVEFQKMELTRLLRENERLNTRLDRLFDEIRHLRDMQQREQVLRQQEQALRRQIQETLDRVTSRPSLPPPSPAPGEPSMPPPSPPRPEAPEAPELVLTRTVAAKRPITKLPTAKHPNKEQPKPAPRTGPGFLATGRSGATGRAGRDFAGPGRRAPGARGFTATPATPARAPAPAPAPVPTPAPASRAVEDGVIGPEEAAELAVILNDIGQSLRDSEAFRRYPPIKPGSVPQRAGDRRPASALPSRAATPIRAAIPTRAATPTRAKASAAASLSAEEAALVAIFDSMGPTAEDRRTAARNVRRLLRNGMPPRAGEP